MNPETITFFVAVWGAVLSTFAVGWNFYRDFSDRGRLKVTCFFGLIAGGNLGVEHKDCLIWTVTNVGRQPVFLKQIGGSLREDRHWVNFGHTDLPKMLKPGEYVVDFMDDFSSINIDEISAFTAYDSLGNTYRAPRKQMKVAKENLKNFLADQQKLSI